MDNKDKKQLNIIKSVQPSKENKEKYFRVERGGLNLSNNKINNNTNPAINKKSDNSQDTNNYFFITHKNNINDIPQSQKGHKQNNNNIFSTANNKSKNGYYNANNKSINNINIIDEKVIKTKLNLVYFESIKNLCNHLNQNFNQLIQNEKNIDINEYLTQMYQNLEILNRKIKLINNIQTFEINKEDYEILNILLSHLIYMNKIFNNTLSKNIVNIYSNLNNLCSSCNCSL